jgi:hypothetical protein
MLCFGTRVPPNNAVLPLSPVFVYILINEVQVEKNQIQIQKQNIFISY